MAALPPLEVGASARTTESVPERSPTSVLDAGALARPKSAAASVRSASTRPPLFLAPSASQLPTTRGISPSWDLRSSEVPSISGRTRQAFLEEDDPGALARERMQGCTARPSRRHRELAMGRRDERSCSRVYREVRDDGRLSLCRGTRPNAREARSAPRHAASRRARESFSRRTRF